MIMCLNKKTGKIVGLAVLLLSSTFSAGTVYACSRPVPPAPLIFKPTKPRPPLSPEQKVQQRVSRHNKKYKESITSSSPWVVIISADRASVLRIIPSKWVAVGLNTIKKSDPYVSAFKQDKHGVRRYLWTAKNLISYGESLDDLRRKTVLLSNDGNRVVTFLGGHKKGIDVIRLYNKGQVTHQYSFSEFISPNAKPEIHHGPCGEEGYRWFKKEEIVGDLITFETSQNKKWSIDFRTGKRKLLSQKNAGAPNNQVSPGSQVKHSE